MARYSCVTQLVGSAEQLSESIRAVLERCQLNVLHSSPDYWVAGEPPGKNPHTKLVTVEVFVDRNPWKMALAMLSCSALIFLLGATWLGVWLNQNVEPTSILAVLNKGVFPFIPGDLVKCGLAAVLLPTIWCWVGRERPPADS